MNIVFSHYAKSVSGALYILIPWHSASHGTPSIPSEKNTASVQNPT